MPFERELKIVSLGIVQNQIQSEREVQTKTFDLIVSCAGMSDVSVQIHRCVS